MKAPDKIYVPIIDMGVEEGGEQMFAIWWNRDKSAEHSEHKGVAEFVSKDAILKRLKTQQDKCVFRSNYWDFWQAVINEIKAL